MRKIGVGYCRVSTEEQVIDGNSLEVQKREIIRFCKENDIILKSIYTDMGVSAFKKKLKDRPQGKFIIGHIVKKEIDCVVAISNDRIFRSLEDSVVVSQIAKKNNVKFVYSRQPNFEDKNIDFVLNGISSVYNEYQSMITSEKVKANMIDKVTQGKWNGPAPFGYKLVNKKLEIFEEEANMVKLIYSLYTEQFMGFESICNYLNSNNIMPQKKKVWSKSSVGDILKNEAYTGKIVYNRRAPSGMGVKFNPKEEWIIVKNAHTPIITEEVYNKAQELLSKKVKRSGVDCIDRSAVGKLPLSGLLVCGNCHNIYTATSNHTKKQGKVYYYMCVSRKRYGKSICNNHMIPAELLEKFVLYRMREILTSDMYNKHFTEQLERTLENVKAQKKELKNIEGNIKKLNSTKVKLVDMIITEDNEGVIQAYREKLNLVIEQLEREQETLLTYNAIDIEEEEKLIKKQFKLKYNDITYKDFQQLDKAQLKILFNELIDNIEIQELTLSDNELNKKNTSCYNYKYENYRL